MIAVDIPGLGKGVVLPPCYCTGDCICHRGADVYCECVPTFCVDDIVNVDEECPTCGGWGAVNYGKDACPRCGTQRVDGLVFAGSGTISVPYVVREVLPIVKVRNFGPHSEPSVLPCIEIQTDGTALYWWHHDGGYKILRDLPDAQPGGVCLVVERAS